MIITVTFFSVGGYMLIQTGFNNSFEREVENIYQENDILVTSLAQELLSTWENYAVNEQDVVEKYQILGNSLTSMTFETFNGNVSFCIRDNEGNLIYQNGGFSEKSKLVEEVYQNERGYIINKDNSSYKIHSIRSFSLSGTNFYVENSRDISQLFLNREEQFKTLYYYTLILMLASGIVIFIVTRWLVKPIKRLSMATKEVASSLSVVPVKVNSDDEIGQLTVDFNTMTKRLETTMAKLRETAQRQEIFVGNFAHELKTPLTSIIGYGDMLRSLRLSEEEIISYANLIVEEGKRLESLSMKLLELIVLKKQDFKMYEVSATIFFHGINDMVRLMMAQKEIDFEIEVEAGKLYIEPDLMKTVCLNLLDNARKAVDQGGKIRLTGRNLLDGYEISVSDNGQGMALGELDKIKEAFYMVDKSRSRQAGGAGLGLAICEQIAILHGTTLRFESELTKGTTVKIILKGAEADEMH